MDQVSRINSKHLDRLDHLKVFAMVLVTIQHFPFPLWENYGFIEYFNTLGFYGVGIFFMISAFLFTVLSDGGKKEIISQKLVLMNRPDLAKPFYYSFLGNFDQLILGMIVGKHYVNGFFDKIFKNQIYALFSMIVGIGILIFIQINNEHVSEFHYALDSLSVGLVCMGYMFLKCFSKGVINNSLLYLSKLVYSMLMFHIILGISTIKIISKFVDILPFSGLQINFFNTLMVFPVSIVFAILVRTFIEEPFLEMKVKYFKD